MDENKQPGIRFNTIMLVKEDFYRVHEMPKTIKINLDMHSNISYIDDKSYNELTTILIGYNEDKEEVLKLTSMFVGIFSKIKGQENMNIKEFMEKNSSALMFPYIREHITAITQKSGINPIILAPINVQALIDASKRSI